LPTTFEHSKGQLDDDPIFPCRGVPEVQRYGTVLSVDTYKSVDTDDVSAEGSVQTVVMKALTEDLYPTLASVVRSCKGTDSSEDGWFDESDEAMPESGQAIGDDSTWFSTVNTPSQFSLSLMTDSQLANAVTVSHTVLARQGDYVIAVRALTADAATKYADTMLG
jgi:hypothetical protein